MVLAHRSGELSLDNAFDLIEGHPARIEHFRHGSLSEERNYVVFYEIVKRPRASNNLVMNRIYKLLESLEVLLSSAIGERPQSSACHDCGEIVV